MRNEKLVLTSGLFMAVNGINKQGDDLALNSPTPAPTTPQTSSFSNF
jgi:hypothetical protein